MIPYGRQLIDAKDVNAVLRTLKSDFITQGPCIVSFEKALARFCGAKYAVAVSSGTAALHLAYLAANIGKGDEVITTPNTFVATTNMLLATGAKPIFCDIHLDTYNVDEKKIEKLITKRTKAIIPVHFAGLPCNMNSILKIARKHKLLVIEDGCHALGATYNNKKIGSIGDMTAFSFHPVKPITTGEGGAVVTNNKKFYQKLILLRSHGVYKDENGKNVMTELGYNYRLTDMGATLGESQLKKLGKFIEKRQRIAGWYERELDNVKEVVLPKGTQSALSSWHIYVIRVADPTYRDSLMKYLQKKGIGVNFHYPAVYSHPYYRSHGYKKTSLVNEDIYTDSCITLPCFVSLSKKDVIHISDTIKSFFDKKKNL